MKINIFVVSLLALVKTLAVTSGIFLLMLLVFSDTLGEMNAEEVFLYVFFGLFFYSLVATGYVFSILLPMYYIDRPNFLLMTAHEGIQHHMPIISLVILVFAGIAALIAGTNGMAEGLVQANFFNTFVMVYSGLIFFEYQVRSAMQKKLKFTKGSTQP